MEKLLEEMLAREAVIATINRLFIYTDERDWPAVKDCLAAEVHFDMTSVVGGEPAVVSAEQIVAGWEQGLKPLQAIHHQAGNHIVSVQGGEANAFCYGIASHYLPTRSGNNVRVFAGSYDFHLVQQAGGGWKIDRFRFNLKYIDGNKDLEAEAA